MSSTGGYRCGKAACNQPLFLGAITGTIVRFQLAPYFWYIEVICLACGCRNFLPALQHGDEAVTAGCRVRVDNLPDRSMVEDYEATTGRKVLVVRNLTYEQDQQVAAYRQRLEQLRYLPGKAA